MYDTKKLTKKVNRLYESGALFRSYIEQTQLFPYEISLKKISQIQIQKDFLKLSKSIEKLNSLFPLEYKEIAFKTLGRQKIPCKVVFNSTDEYLEFIGKRETYETFIALYEKIVHKYPALQTFFIEKPFVVLEYQAIWSKLLAVIEFLECHENPKIYLRELPIRGVDTKFIEKYKKIIDTLVSTLQNTTPLTSLSKNSFVKKYGFLYPEPLIRFRILDPLLHIQGLSDLSVTQSEFQSLSIPCKKIFIIENEITTLSFPKTKSAIVIFGRGYGVAILKNIPWFWDKKIYYWGDIDLDGYAILSQIRGYYNHVQSILMDEHTFVTYKDLAVEVNAKKTLETLPHLQPHEQRVYEKIYISTTQTQIRLEQERIPFEALEHL